MKKNKSINCDFCLNFNIRSLSNFCAFCAWQIWYEWRMTYLQSFVYDTWKVDLKIFYCLGGIQCTSYPYKNFLIVKISKNPPQKWLHYKKKKSTRFKSMYHISVVWLLSLSLYRIMYKLDNRQPLIVNAARML